MAYISQSPTTLTISRLYGDRTPTHNYSCVDKERPTRSAADIVEIVNGRREEAIWDLKEDIFSIRTTPHLYGNDGKSVYPGTLTIFSGRTRPRYGSKKIPGAIKEINDKASYKSRNVVILQDVPDCLIGHLFEDHHGFSNNRGYYDWGISHPVDTEYLSSVCMVKDVAGFWNTDHSVGTIMIPGTVTIGGLLKSKTIMRKANVMISTYPPYEHIIRGEVEYSDYEIQQSKLVSEAIKIWEPDTTYFSMSKDITGTILGNGDSRLVATNGISKSGKLIRWSLKDKNKGPVNSIKPNPVVKYY